MSCLQEVAAALPLSAPPALEPVDSPVAEFNGPKGATPGPFDSVMRDDGRNEKRARYRRPRK
jgi:hypothetical protein